MSIIFVYSFRNGIFIFRHSKYSTGLRVFAPDVQKRKSARHIFVFCERWALMRPQSILHQAQPTMHITRSNRRLFIIAIATTIFAAIVSVAFLAGRKSAIISNSNLRTNGQDIDGNDVPNTGRDSYQGANKLPTTGDGDAANAGSTTSTPEGSKENDVDTLPPSSQADASVIVHSSLKNDEPRTPLSDLIGDDAANIKADVSWLLNFAIIGHSKCATVSLSTTLAASFTVFDFGFTHSLSPLRVCLFFLF